MSDDAVGTTKKPRSNKLALLMGLDESSAKELQAQAKKGACCLLACWLANRLSGHLLCDC